MYFNQFFNIFILFCSIYVPWFMNILYFRIGGDKTPINKDPFPSAQTNMVNANLAKPNQTLAKVGSNMTTVERRAK